MIPKISRERQNIVRKIVVTNIEASKKINKELFNHADAKLRYNRSKENKKQIGHRLLEEYLNDSSLHGVKYLGHLKIKSSTLGKIFWALIMIFSFACLICMVETFWTRYTADPVRTVIESFQSPTFLIPFPAVTLCPLVPPLISRRMKLLESLRLPRNMDNKTAMFLLKYIFHEFFINDLSYDSTFLRYGPEFSNGHSPGVKKYLQDFKTLLKMNQLTLIKFIKFLRPCEDIIETCEWDGVRRNCSDLFHVSHTNIGICCSFNYHLADYIRSDKIVNYDSLLRTAFFGPSSGLTAVLHRDLLLENDGTGDIVRFATNSIGILVFCHHPLEYITAIFTRHFLQAKQELRVAVNPSFKKKLSEYYHRDSHGTMNSHCVDQGATLKYFPTYRYSNCYTSCAIEIVLQVCGCLPYYYEPIAHKHSLKICDLEDFACLHANAEAIRIIQDIDIGNFTCTCRNPCKNVYYEMQATSIVLNGQNFNVAPIYKNLSDAQGVLKIFMGFETFTVTNTVPIADELYLLASVGGIFSLFLGCSFISVVEIFYFAGLFLRSYRNSKRS